MWRFVTYGLVHVGYLHLLSNCLVGKQVVSQFCSVCVFVRITSCNLPGTTNAWGTIGALLWQRPGN